MSVAFSSPVEHRQHAAGDLSRLFERTFAIENTVLVHTDAWPLTSGYATEPVYLPSDDRCPVHRIVYAHGFFASALHEIAHWCVAGTKRRQHVDYGYWYEPDDRDEARQAEFERVEARPQAIEMAFGRAADFPFRVSLDNLSGIAMDREQFERKVQAQFEYFQRAGFPQRAQRFIEALEQFYHG